MERFGKLVVRGSSSIPPFSLWFPRVLELELAQIPPNDNRRCTEEVKEGCVVDACSVFLVLVVEMVARGLTGDGGWIDTRLLESLIGVILSS
jgi:hypothetical protein